MFRRIEISYGFYGEKAPGKGQSVIGQRSIHRRIVSAEASAALHSADLRQDQAGTTSEKSSEASLSFRRLISLSQCSLDSASGPSSHCSGLRPVCWPRGNLGK